MADARDPFALGIVFLFGAFKLAIRQQNCCCSIFPSIFPAADCIVDCNCSIPTMCHERK